MPAKPHGAVWARISFVLAGVFTFSFNPAVTANDAMNAIEALAPAEQRAEPPEHVSAYALEPSRLLAPTGPSRRPPQVLIFSDVPPVPARMPRRVLAERTSPTTTALEDELKCLAEGVYFEARGESYMGQLAVAQVILNRVASEAYPDTVCDVVYQNAQKHNRCQFSFACDDVADVIEEPRAWRWANRVARSVLLGTNRIVNLNAATNYHATYVSPGWAKQMRRLAKIGLHIFYRA